MQQQSDQHLLTILGISDMRISNDTNETLITYSLGSCLGVTMHDEQLHLGGMIHCMLPLSKLNPEKAGATPAMFVDSGIVALFQALLDRGARADRLTVKVAGGASPMDASQHFRIGERNHAVLRKVLWKNDLMIAGEDVGGTAPRTLLLDIACGRACIKKAGQEFDL